MPETDSPYMTRAECTLMSRHMTDAIQSNTESIDKLNKTITGNGDDGLILTVNRLMWRNQLLDKGTSILIAILTSIVTAVIMSRLGI